MRKIMACLDVGSDTIKLVVGEFVKKKLNILACSTTPSKGISNGIVIDANKLLEPLSNVIHRCEEVVGIPIKQMIVSVPANDAVYSIVTGTIKIVNEGNLITGKDVVKVMQQAIRNNRDDSLEYISMMPTSFSLDDHRIVKDPKGLTSKGLSVRGVMVSTPKKNIYPILAVLERLQIDVLDITLSSIGDYFEYKNKELDKGVNVVINVGDEITTLSVFNRGVLTNSSVIHLGGANIDNDLAFVYKIPIDKAKELKENFAMSNRNDAVDTEIVEVDDKHGRKISINQLEASEVVTSRVLEILNLCKKEINHLTKKEISYIIFTGGLTESRGFINTLEEVFRDIAKLGDIREIGVRHNKYSVCLGLLKFYDYNARLKDRDYSIFSIEEQQKLSGANYDGENDSIIGKLFGYIFNG